MKALIDTTSDRIPGFTVFGVGGGEITGTVQIAMIAGLPYPYRGLIVLFSSVPPK